MLYDRKSPSSYFLLSALAVIFLGAYSFKDGTAQAASSCPTTGYTASTGALSLSSDCTINGNVNLSGSATLTITGGTLSINGNLNLSNTAAFSVNNGSLSLPQTNVNQDAINLNNSSQLSLTNSTLITSATANSNFPVLLQANGSSTVTFNNSTLNTNTGSWLQGNFNGSSTLNATNSQNLPTEIFPADSSHISVSGSSFATVWLSFLPGSAATVSVPTLNSSGDYNLAFGPATGVNYSVSILGSQSRIGFNSFPNSSLILNGHGNTPGVTDAPVVFGYYVVNNTAPVTINGLHSGNNITQTFNDSGRKLQLQNVNLNPFPWQVYAAYTNNNTVTIQNSLVNEAASVINAHLSVLNSVLQLAVAGAVGPGSFMNITNTQIWSQSVQAENGGQVNILNSMLNGNFVTAGPGSSITMTNVGDSGNGISPQGCAPIGGYPPNNNGVPLCNPFNLLYQCAQIVPAGGTISGFNPTCISTGVDPIETYHSWVYENALSDGLNGLQLLAGAPAPTPGEGLPTALAILALLIVGGHSRAA